MGTYRLLLKPRFVKSQRFYSQTEFNISKLTKKNSLTLLEAGRSCVHKNYRNGKIIKLHLKTNIKNLTLKFLKTVPKDCKIISVLDGHPMTLSKLYLKNIH